MLHIIWWGLFSKNIFTYLKALILIVEVYQFYYSKHTSKYVRLKNLSYIQHTIVSHHDILSIAFIMIQFLLT